ncbi:MAG: hypothetical protein WBF89_24230 [Steroidobacteraceae bacterium]
MRWNPRRWLRRYATALCAAALCGTGSAAQPTGWTSSYLTRVEALAALQTLNADLLSHDSATLTLERWCGAHHLATPPRIIAARVTGADKAATEELRRELGVMPGDVIRYRRVRLMCGTRVLSEADNWYVPGRLTAEMNKLLDATDTPFGVAVRALHFQRHTLSATLLWSPLPPGWDMNAAGGSGVDGDPMPSRLLEHRAVLSLPDGTPFSEVVETYTDQILDFPVPQP